jgi:tripartite-type tricarboxylate transporter receptor subunit TctC
MPWGAQLVDERRHRQAPEHQHPGRPDQGVTKANPAKLNHASGGNGSAGHLAGEIPKARRAFCAAHPVQRRQTWRNWRCSAVRVDFNFDNPPPHPATSKVGKLKAIAVTMAHAAPPLPDTYRPWQKRLQRVRDRHLGTGRLAGTPGGVVKSLSVQVTLCQRLLNSPEVKTCFNTPLAELVASTPAQFGASAEKASWQK